MLIHYADVPHFNKECGLRGNISKYLNLNIDLISPEKKYNPQKIKETKDKAELYHIYPWTVRTTIFFISDILSLVKNLDLERRLLSVSFASGQVTFFMLLHSGFL